jgi:hypothetical protein
MVGSLRLCVLEYSCIVASRNYACPLENIFNLCSVNGLKLHAKNGHLFKDDRTASRFSSLFADIGDYDDRTTPGGAQLDKLGSRPYMMTRVLDTG